MRRLLAFISGMISFIIGGMIFLVGIGAIAGTAGGLIFMFLGGLVTLIGVAAIVNFLITGENREIRVNDIIELVKINGRWAA